MTRHSRTLLLKALRLPLRETLLLSLLVVFTTVALGSNLAQVALAQQATTRSQTAAAGRAQIDVQAIAGGGLNRNQMAAVIGSPLIADKSPLYEKSSFAIAATNPQASVPITLVGETGGAVALRPLTLAQGHLPISCQQAVISASLLPVLAAHQLKATSLLLPGSSGLFRVSVSGLVAMTQTGVSAPPGAVYLPTDCLQKSFYLGLHTLLIAGRLVPGENFKATAAALMAKTGNGVVISSPRAGTAATAPYQIFGLITGASLLFGVMVTMATTALLLGRRRDVLETLTLSGVSRNALRLASLELATRFSGAGVITGAVLLIPVDSARGTPLLTALATILESVALVFLASTLTGTLASLPLQKSPLADRTEAQWRGAPWIGAAGILLTIAGLSAVKGGTASSQLPGAMAVLIGTTLAVAAVVPYLSHPRLGSARWLTQLLALRSVWLRPRRTMMSLALVMISVSTTVAVTSLTASELAAATSWVHELFPGEAIVVSPVPEPLALASALQGASGVASTTSISLFTAATDGRLTPFMATSPSHFAPGLAVQPMAGSPPQSLALLSAPSTAVVPEQLAAANNWKKGQEVLAEGPNGKQIPLKVIGIVAHTFPGGAGQPSIIVSTATAQKLGAPPVFNDIAVRCATGSCISSSTRVAARYGWALFTQTQLTSAIQALVGQDMGKLAIAPIILLLATVIAIFAVNWNNAQDQRHDFSLLRTVGLTRSGLASLIWWQSVLVSGLGGILALGAGVLLSAVFIRVASTPALELPLAIPLSVLLPVLALALAAVGTALVPSQVLSRESISTALNRS